MPKPRKKPTLRDKRRAKEQFRANLFDDYDDFSNDHATINEWEEIEEDYDDEDDGYGDLEE